MKRPAFPIIFFFACLAALSSASAFADGVLTKVDEKAIHVVVQSQLDAFRKDDAVRAFGFATSSTRSQIGSPDKFLRIVKEQYMPIYRHRVAIFSNPEMIGGEAIQTVRLTDADGLVWVALYKMQREKDGKWRIEGCQLFGTSSVSV